MLHDFVAHVLMRSGRLFRALQHIQGLVSLIDPLEAKRILGQRLLPGLCRVSQEHSLRLSAIGAGC